MNVAIDKQAPSIHFVGVDPSLTATGLAILSESGDVELRTIETTPHSHRSKYHRVRYIATTIREAIAALGSAVVCLEGPYIAAKNMATARSLIELHTMVQHLLYWGKIPFREIPPATLKQFVCNKGNAKKEMIMMEVLDRWKIKTQDNNQADAAELAQMSRAIHAVQTGGDSSEWFQYQLAIVQKILSAE